MLVEVRNLEQAERRREADPRPLDVALRQGFTAPPTSEHDSRALAGLKVIGGDQLVSGACVGMLDNVGHRGHNNRDVVSFHGRVRPAGRD